MANAALSVCFNLVPVNHRDRSACTENGSVVVERAGVVSEGLPATKNLNPVRESPARRKWQSHPMRFSAFKVIVYALP
jgi:hypothetical protein